MFQFCTIVTPDYLPYAYALHDSVLAFEPNARLAVFVAASKIAHSGLLSKVGVEYFFLEDLCQTPTAKNIYKKYYETDVDAFRWSMKPILIKKLLENSSDKVIYVDCDIRFFSSYRFLFDLLEEHNVLLSPHFRSSNPKKDMGNYILQFTSGIYNGGFVGVSKKGTEAMQWWAEVCETLCVKDASRGQFVDQTHLNLLPVFFEGVHILKHRGCNVANWNQQECKRIAKNGVVMINDSYPIAFIHFTKSTINGIENGSDDLLSSHLVAYKNNIALYSGQPTMNGFASKTQHKRRVSLKQKIRNLFR